MNMHNWKVILYNSEPNSTQKIDGCKYVITKMVSACAPSPLQWRPGLIFAYPSCPSVVIIMCVKFLGLRTRLRATV